MSESEIRDAVEDAAPAGIIPPAVEIVERDLADYPKNDVGNANRLIARHGRDLIHVPNVGWHGWDGRRWDFDKGESIASVRAHLTAEATHDEARAIAAEGQRTDETAKQFDERVDKHHKWAVVSGNSSRLANSLKEAQHYRRQPPEALDADPWLVTASNVTLRLAEGGPDGGVRAREHRRDDLITRVLGAAYEPEADAPFFRQFLDTVLPDRPVQGFVQRFFGSCLTGDASDQAIMLLYGTGANGKSTLIEIVTHVLGDYALSMPFGSLLHNDRARGADASPDLAPLPGARLVTASEPDSGSRLSESQLKQLTGGERVTVRHLHQPFFDFEPQFKLVLSFNEKPRVRGADEGIWRRLMLVPFEVLIPAQDRLPVREMRRRLRADVSGVLNWIVDGYRMWREDGLAPPDRVKMATAGYRSEQDPVGQFLTDCVSRNAHDSVRARIMYGCYCAWCRETTVEPLSQNAFGRALTAKGIERDTIGNVFYRGVALTDLGLGYTQQEAERPAEGDHE